MVTVLNNTLSDPTNAFISILRKGSNRWETEEMRHVCFFVMSWLFACTLLFAIFLMTPSITPDAKQLSYGNDGSFSKALIPSFLFLANLSVHLIYFMQSELIEIHFTNPFLPPPPILLCLITDSAHHEGAQSHIIVCLQTCQHCNSNVMRAVFLTMLALPYKHGPFRLRYYLPIFHLRRLICILTHDMDVQQHHIGLSLKALKVLMCERKNVEGRKVHTVCWWALRDCMC